MNKYAHLRPPHTSMTPQLGVLACHQKVRHRSLAGAQAAQAHMQRKEPNKRVNVIYCSLCGGWHIGTTKR